MADEGEGQAGQGSGQEANLGAAAESSTLGAGSAEGSNQAEELVPIERVRGLQSANDRLRAELGELRAELDGAKQSAEAAGAAISEAAGQALANLRRALHAENAGRVVPELIVGDTFDALEASVEVAKAAFDRAAELARASMAGQPIPAGTPARSATAAAAAAGLSAQDKIAAGLAARSSE